MNNFRKIVAATLMAVVVGVSGCNVFRGESTPGEYVDDVAITANVKTKLLDSGKVDRRRLAAELEARFGHEG